MFKNLAVLLCLSANLQAQSIFDLARSGTVDEMQTYLDKNPEHINQISENGFSAFLLAAYRGNNKVANLLIEKGADLSSCYSEGSAIYALIYKNNTELLTAILKKGVNVNDTCQFQQLGYPIHFALSLQRYEVISLLFNYNIDLEVKDPQGRDILQLLNLYNDPKFYEIYNQIER
jgi:ankyrin repeat protein